jgi:exodeoxyribonuclease VII large subunit
VVPVSSRIWQVGLLCRAIQDVLQRGFDQVRVTGEISGFSRPASGHCYFSLKDASGQIRCAMFRRVASALDFQPREGDQVEVLARISVFEARGDLQLVVEGMRRAGQGTLFEQFLQRKERLQKEGWFDASRKRALPLFPVSIGVVTSLAAAAWRDVVHALQRRVPHIPVVLSPASVQGESAPAELIAALHALYALPEIDVILLVRGGGSIEDLWAFNDEHLARTIARSPVPIVSGVGHETDFTIADFVADLRAPTPTAAAELVCEPLHHWQTRLMQSFGRLHDGVMQQLDQRAQRLDRVAVLVSKPSVRLEQHRSRLDLFERRMQYAQERYVQKQQQQIMQQQQRLPLAVQQAWSQKQLQWERAAMRLDAVNPLQVLQRGYVWLHNEQGQTLSKKDQLSADMRVSATLVDGTVDMLVLGQE